MEPLSMGVGRVCRSTMRLPERAARSGAPMDERIRILQMAPAASWHGNFRRNAFSHKLFCVVDGRAGAFRCGGFLREFYAIEKFQELAEFHSGVGAQLGVY